MSKSMSVWNYTYNLAVGNGKSVSKAAELADQAVRDWEDGQAESFVRGLDQSTADYQQCPSDIEDIPSAGK